MELPSPNKPTAAPPAACVASRGLRLPALEDRRGGKRRWAAAASFPGVDASLSDASPEEAWLLPKCGFPSQRICLQAGIGYHMLDLRR